MTLDELFRAFLKAYATYYNVKETPEKDSPFDAEAVFSSCEEQYFLLKGITLSETRIAEFVRFAKRERLTRAELERLDALAWEQGLAAAAPGPGHKCSDVTATERRTGWGSTGSAITGSSSSSAPRETSFSIGREDI